MKIVRFIFRWPIFRVSPISTRNSSPPSETILQKYQNTALRILRNSSKISEPSAQKPQSSPHLSSISTFAAGCEFSTAGIFLSWMEGSFRQRQLWLSDVFRISWESKMQFRQRRLVSMRQRGSFASIQVNFLIWMRSFAQQGTHLFVSLFSSLLCWLIWYKLKYLFIIL